MEKVKKPLAAINLKKLAILDLSGCLINSKTYLIGFGGQF
jgi:hypothetical protein